MLRKVLDLTYAHPIRLIHLFLTINMADPFSLITGILGTITASLDLVRSVHDVISTIKDAPEATRRIESELVALQSILQQIDSSKNRVSYFSSNVTSSSAFILALERCHTLVMAIGKRLDAFRSSKYSPLDRLKTFLKQNEMNSNLDALHRVAQILHMSISIDGL